MPWDLLYERLESLCVEAKTRSKRGQNDEGKKRPGNPIRLRQRPIPASHEGVGYFLKHDAPLPD